MYLLYLTSLNCTFYNHFTSGKETKANSLPNVFQCFETKPVTHNLTRREKKMKCPSEISLRGSFSLIISLLSKLRMIMLQISQRQLSKKHPNWENEHNYCIMAFHDAICKFQTNFSSLYLGIFLSNILTMLGRDSFSSQRNSICQTLANMGHHVPTQCILIMINIDRVRDSAHNHSRSWRFVPDKYILEIWCNIDIFHKISHFFRSHIIWLMTK